MTQAGKRYTGVAIGLHWLVAFLIFAAFPLGVYMHDLPLSPTKLQLYSYHKWIGITVLLLAVLRILWRIGHPAPPLPDSMPAWQKAASHGVHALLNLLTLAVPFSGWLMSSAKGFQTLWFGVLPLPDLVGKDKALGELLAQVHMGLNLALAILVVLHVAAALKHHFIDRDDVLTRMSPLGKGASL